MTSIFNTPHGEMQQFVQNLHNGGFTYEDVRRVIKKPSLASGFHELLNPKLEFKPPTWWRTPEQQLERARQLWVDGRLWRDIHLPKPPAEFVPQTTSEVLLLHVPDIFDNLWDLVDGPDGYTTNRSEHLKSDMRNLMLSPDACRFIDPIWLAFDAERDTVRRLDDVEIVYDVATEAFSALIQFPDLALAWLDRGMVYLKGLWQMDHGAGIWKEGIYVSVDERRRTIELRGSV